MNINIITLNYPNHFEHQKDSLVHFRALPRLLLRHIHQTPPILLVIRILHEFLQGLL